MTIEPQGVNPSHPEPPDPGPAGGLSDQDTQRARASLAIMRFARTPSFRAAFPQRDLTVIPVLREDSVRYLFERLAEAGGYAVAVQADGVTRFVELQVHEVSS